MKLALIGCAPDSCSLLAWNPGILNLPADILLRSAPIMQTQQTTHTIKQTNNHNKQINKHTQTHTNTHKHKHKHKHTHTHTHKHTQTNK